MQEKGGKSHSAGAQRARPCGKSVMSGRDWSTGRQFLMACCHEKSATGSHLLCSHRQLGKEGEERAGGERGRLLTIPSLASSLLLTTLVKVSWFFIRLKYVKSPIILSFLQDNSGLKAASFFSLNPSPPHFEQGMRYLDWGTPPPPSFCQPILLRSEDISNGFKSTRSILT